MKRTLVRTQGRVNNNSRMQNRLVGRRSYLEKLGACRPSGRRPRRREARLQQEQRRGLRTSPRARTLAKKEAREAAVGWSR